MKNLTITNIVSAVSGKYAGPQELENKEITAVVTDSRKAVDGCLYAAIRGERVDGHTFIPQVREKGALVSLVEDASCSSVMPVIIVQSVLQALKDLAEFYLRQLGKPVVGIIGSVGKTSTKEMTASVLAQKFKVLKTEGNFNNELGVPLTIFRMNEKDDIGVIEMGINHFGEMHRLAKIVRPDTVVMTNIGTAHLEFLKTRDGILRAKSEVFDFFRPDGHIVLNGDDDKLSEIEEKQGVTPVRFGIDREGYSHPNDVWADEIESRGLEGIFCRIHTPEYSFDVTIPAPGKHMVYNALAGVCVGRIYGLTAEEIRAGIENYAPISGRFRILHTDKITVIDDCYNANPASMRASLGVLAESAGRKVAVLGDMGELGDHERELHADIGTYAAQKKIDALYCAGDFCLDMADAASSFAAEHHLSMDIRHFKDTESLKNALPDLIQTGDTVLVKASHFMKFDRVVTSLQTF